MLRISFPGPIVHGRGDPLWSPCSGSCRRVALVLSFANKVFQGGIGEVEAVEAEQSCEDLALHLAEDAGEREHVVAGGQHLFSVAEALEDEMLTQHGMCQRFRIG